MKSIHFSQCWYLFSFFQEAQNSNLGNLCGGLSFSEGEGLNIDWG